MQNRTLFTFILVSLVVVGCASDPERQKTAEKIATERKITQRKAKLIARVKIVMYDTSPRAESDHVDIFDETRPVQRPHKDIAVLTCEGTPGEEAEMTEAIIYRARVVGASAVIILPPSRSGWGDRRVFRAKAVSYEQLPK